MYVCIYIGGLCTVSCMSVLDTDEYAVELIKDILQVNMNTIMHVCGRTGTPDWVLSTGEREASHHPHCFKYVPQNGYTHLFSFRSVQSFPHVQNPAHFLSLDFTTQYTRHYCCCCCCCFVAHLVFHKSHCPPTPHHQYHAPLLAASIQHLNDWI